MIEDAVVRLYQVNKCGYFRWASDEPEFGSLSATLQDIISWTSDKPLGDTKTFEPDDSDIDPTFCFDIKKQSGTGDVLLVTWNQTPAAADGVASVDLQGTVGSAKIRKSKVPEGFAPGYPSYFWFIPASGLFATVRFRDLRLGLNNMKQYVYCFLSKYSRHVCVDTEHHDIHIAGYRSEEGSIDSQVRPVFEYSLVRRPGHLDIIRDDREKITRILRKNQIFPSTRPETNLLRTLVEYLGIGTENITRKDKVTIEFEVEYTPTSEELEQILSEWEQSSGTLWDNVGFSFGGTKKWLSQAIAKDEFSLDVTRRNGVVTADSLLQALEAGRSEILGLAR